MHARDRVVIREIDRGAPRANLRILDPIVALYRSDRSSWNAEVLLDEKSSAAADALGALIESSERKPLIAVIHWEDNQLPSAASEIVGSRGVLVGIDLSSVDQRRRGVAVALAVKGLSQRMFDVVISSNVRPLLETGTPDSDCIFLNFQHRGMHLTAATQQLRHLNGLLAEDAAELLPFEVGLSLKEVRFIEEIARSGSSPSEPFRRTLRKLRSLGIACAADSSVDGSEGHAHPQDHEDAFRLTPGWMSEDASDGVSVVFSCNEPNEPCTWISLRAMRGSNRLLAVVNSLLSVVATPDLEWQRWLA